MINYENRIEELNNLILTIAAGNFDARGTITGEKDEVDALITGINMLAEELKTTTVSVDYLNSILRGVADMLFVLDTNGNIMQINTSVERILKYRSEELGGQPFLDLMSTEDNDCCPMEYLKTQDVVHNLELNLLDNRNISVPVSCSSSNIYDKGGVLTGSVHIAKDISRIKKTERNLIAKNKELDTFVYRASHDLKGPLSSLLGIVQVAQREVGDEKALEYINHIKESASRLDRILEDLMEIVSYTEIKSDFEEIDFQNIITEVQSSVKYAPEMEELSVETNFNHTHKIYSNHKILVSVFRNLIDNAFKYRKNNVESCLWISSEDIHEGVRLIFEDNGTGIPENSQDKIFDMFYRANNYKEGSGLGLYMVKTNLDKIDAEIQVSSIYNQGTRFIIDIPEQPDPVY